MRTDDLPRNSKIFFAGIGGISMSALAMILCEKGYNICGYDRCESPVTRSLTEAGITVSYDAEDCIPDGVTHAVFSAAFSSEHPVMQSLNNKNIKIYSRAELLGAIADGYHNSIAIAGTHGKSTTCGMTGHIFFNSAKTDPTVIDGAVMCDVNSTYRIGSDDNFIFEACEYKDSFLSLYPHIAVVLNVRLDHTDYFENLDSIVKSFSEYMAHTGKDGYAVVNLDCPDSMRAAESYQGTLISFSASGNKNAFCHAENIDMSDGFARFDACVKGREPMRIKLSIPGLHNVSNALAAVCCACISNIDNADIIDGLQSYKGIRRRFEHKGQFCGAEVYDDYAHHPDEIRSTLATAKAITKNRVVCVFQPHNYSRLRDLFDDFTKSFDDADVCVFCKLYAARGTVGDEVSAKLLSERISGSVYFDTFPEVREYLKTILQKDDLLLIVGAGDIAALANDI